MDMEKPNEPIFKIDEERLEKFLKEMPEEVKEGMKSLDENNAWLTILLMMFFDVFAMPNDFECDKKE